MKKLTEEQEYSIYFYAINDAKLINNIMWKASKEKCKGNMDIIYSDGLQVIKEMESAGQTTTKSYERFINRLAGEVKQGDYENILKRAYQDINNIYNAMSNVETDMVVYRNVQQEFTKQYKIGQSVTFLGFSSCSKFYHEPCGQDTMKNAYGGNSNNVSLCIHIPKGCLALDLGNYQYLANEEDEIIFPPMKCLIKSKEEKNGKLVYTLEVQNLLPICDITEREKE